MDHTPTSDCHDIEKWLERIVANPYLVHDTLDSWRNKAFEQIGPLGEHPFELSDLTTLLLAWCEKYGTDRIDPEPLTRVDYMINILCTPSYPPGLTKPRMPSDDDFEKALQEALDFEVRLRNIIIDTPAMRPVLNDMDEEFANYIRKHPGKGDDEIAHACGQTSKHFHQCFIQKLRCWGFTTSSRNPNHNAVYFPPKSMSDQDQA